MRKFIIVFLVLAASPALAAKEKEKPALAVSKQDCEFLAVAHQPSPDTEYKPDVDVHGKPVMEADISPSVIKPPEKYSFDITVDTAKYMGLTVPAGVMGEAKMGTITVEKGQVKFNGNPLEGDAEAALKALCAEKDKKPK
jgi:hypothetical protein